MAKYADMLPLICPQDHALLDTPGDGYLCPVCGQTYPVKGGIASFLASPDEFYEGHYGNQTHFLPRSEKFRHIWPLWLINSGYVWSVRKSVPAGAKVVELGCAGGVRYFGQRYHMIGCDLNWGGLQLIDFYPTWHLAKRYDLLRRPRIDWRMGFLYALYCLPLSGQAFIDSLRQQGFRILLGAYVGATSVTTLATTRTFANVLQQGLGTITGPLLPELMRYVVDRDQERMEGAFAIVWLNVFALLMPGVLLLAILAEPVFVFWTRGAVAFDAILFHTLMSVVTVYAAAQPAAAILQGQNRIAWIIAAAMAAAVGLGVFSLLLIPLFGLRGAGFALLAAELCALVVVVKGALRSLAQSGLQFPLSSLALVLINMASVFGLMFLDLVLVTVHPAYIVMAFLVNLVFAVAYWKNVPQLARDKILHVLMNVKGRILRVRANPIV